MIRKSTPLVLLLAGCGPGGDAITTGEDEATTSTAATTTNTDVGDISSGTTSEIPSSMDGEWLGNYFTGFGYAYFQTCVDDEVWFANNLPGYELCNDEPVFLWMRVSGTVVEGEYGPELTVNKILEGPCSDGTCADGVLMQECASIDWLCAQSPGCSPGFQSCLAGEKCSVTGPEFPYGACTPLDAMPGQSGAPCTVLPDSCDTTLLCHEVEPDTNMGTCAPLCIGNALDVCEDPTLVCEDKDTGPWLCLPP